MLAKRVLELRGLVMAYGTGGHREFLSGVENISPLTRQHMPPRTHLPKTFVPCAGSVHNSATNLKCCCISKALNDVGFSYGRNLLIAPMIVPILSHSLHFSTAQMEE